MTAPHTDTELPDNSVFIVEKNTPKQLAQRFVVLDPDYTEYMCDDLGKETRNIPNCKVINTHVEPTIPALHEGEEAKAKTPDQIKNEVLQMFRDYIKGVLSYEQKVLDKIIEENIDVVKEEVEQANNPSSEPAQQQPPAPDSKPNEPNQVEGEGNDNANAEAEEPEAPRVGLYPELASHLYSSWKSSELEYAKNMIKFFKLVKTQYKSIDSNLESTKDEFKSFMHKPDGKQDKLNHFIESFNKFTDEFPELRPDEQTKEELNNRCDMLNDEFWDIIEQNKENAIQERQRIMNSGWIEHETQQLILKAQQFIGYEIKRCGATLNFIRDYYVAKKGERSLEDYETIVLSLHDQSHARSEISEAPISYEEMLSKNLAIMSEVDAIIEKQDPSDFEIVEAFKRERNILLFRI